MPNENLYNSAIDFLLSFDGITIEDINLHLQPEHAKPEDLKIIYERLCISAQNYQRNPNVIGKSIGGVFNLKTILYDFDPHQVTNNYKKDDATKLLNVVIEKLDPKGKVNTAPNGAWPKYCQAIIDCAYFLNGFPTALDFYKWADAYANDDRIKSTLPLKVSEHIKGMGVALACDFLKEIGYVEYGKPDVHLKDIFRGLNIIDQLEESHQKSEELILKTLDEISLSNNTTPYAVDKVLWLIASGNFYLSKKNIGKQKERFISEMASLN